MIALRSTGFGRPQGLPGRIPLAAVRRPISARGPLLSLALCLCAAAASGPGYGQGHPPEPAAKRAAPEEMVLSVVADYRSAMESRSVERLAAVADPELLVLEGVHKNAGWADYRDRHIGPEMRDWKSFRFRSPKVVDLAVGGGLAYVVQESEIEIASGDGVAALRAAGTFILRKAVDGSWKIRHIHSSAKRMDRHGAKPAGRPRAADRGREGS